MKQFNELGIVASTSSMIGRKIEIMEILNKEIVVEGYRIEKSKYDKGNGKCLWMQIEIDKVKRVVFSGSGALMGILDKITKDSFPFSTKIVQINRRFEFT